MSELAHLHSMFSALSYQRDALAQCLERLSNQLDTWVVLLDTTATTVSSSAREVNLPERVLRDAQSLVRRNVPGLRPFEWWKFTSPIRRPVLLV